jgi:hypothetical protein
MPADDETPGTDNTDAPNDAPAQADAQPAEEPIAEVKQEPAKPPSTEPAKFQADLPADFKEQRTKLLTEKSAAMKKLMDGEIDADQYALEDIRITDALDDMNAVRIRSETLREVNSQNASQHQARAINELIQRTKGEVDYQGDPAAPKQFDMALGMLQQDPASASLDFADVIDKAHRMVAAMRGVNAKTAPVSTAPSRKADAQAPITLRSLPVAAGNNTGGGVIEQMSRLHGPAYEAAFAKLTPVQRASLLDEEA